MLPMLHLLIETRPEHNVSSILFMTIWARKVIYEEVASLTGNFYLYMYIVYMC